MALEIDVRIMDLAHVAMLNVDLQTQLEMVHQIASLTVEKLLQKMVAIALVSTLEPLVHVRLDVALLVDATNAQMVKNV